MTSVIIEGNEIRIGSADHYRSAQIDSLIIEILLFTSICFLFHSAIKLVKSHREKKLEQILHWKKRLYILVFTTIIVALAFFIVIGSGHSEGNVVTNF